MLVEEIQDVVGDSWYGTWQKTGSVTTHVLTPFVKKFDWGSDTETEGNTAAGFVLGTEQAIRGKIAPKMTLAFRNSVAAEALRADLVELTKGTLTAGTQGNAAGKPQHAALLQVKKCNAPVEVGKLTMMEVEFVNIGSNWVKHPSYGDTF